MTNKALTYISGFFLWYIHKTNLIYNYDFYVHVSNLVKHNFLHTYI